MDVLLIVGNGFDLNLGLPTAYDHFYEYYLNNNSPKGKELKRLLQEWRTGVNSDSKEIINWSDLELGLGEASQSYPTPHEYLDDFDDISDELTRYLRVVETLEIKQLDKIAIQFIDDILKVSLLTDLSKFSTDKSVKKKNDNYRGYFDFKPASGLSSYLSHLPSDQSTLNINVMTFNYTNTVERIFESINHQKILADKIILRNIYHIHQDLGEEGVILGVNSIDQIKNTNFHSTYSIYSSVVKPNLLSEYASGIDGKCLDAITHADLIILFGVSLGETDSIWWRRIGNIVCASGKRIVYCPYEKKEYFNNNTTFVVRHTHNIINYLLNRLQLTELECNAMYNQIYPVRKNQMFNFGIFDDLKVEQENNLDKVITALLQS